MKFIITSIDSGKILAREKRCPDCPFSCEEPCVFALTFPLSEFQINQEISGEVVNGEIHIK